MANNRLILYSILWNEMQDICSEYEGEVIDADDGEDNTVYEAKHDAMASLEYTIEVLKALRDEIGKESMKRLKEKYEVE